LFFWTEENFGEMYFSAQGAAPHISMNVLHLKLASGAVVNKKFHSRYSVLAALFNVSRVDMVGA